MTTHAEGMATVRLKGRQLRRPLFLLALVAGDFFAPIAALYVAYRLRFDGVPFASSVEEAFSLPSVQLMMVVTSLVHVFLMRQAGFYRLHVPWLPLDFLFRLVFVETVSVLVFVAAATVLNTSLTSRILVIYLWLVLVAISIALKLGARIVVLLMLCFGVGIKKAALVGNPDVVRRLQQLFKRHPHLGYRVAAVLYRSADEGRFDTVAGARTRGGAAPQMFRALIDLNPDVVIAATAGQRNDEMTELIAECMAHDIEIRLAPEFSEFYTSKRQIDRLGNTSAVRLHSQRLSWGAALIKRSIDIAVAALLLPFLALACGAYAARARRRGVTILTTGHRVGKRGRVFGLYRFHPQVVTSGDTETTGGIQMRPWQVVLPQILNVLRGELSCVGPSASDPERTAHFSSWEKRKLAVRPGVMGFTELNEVRDNRDLSDQMAWDIGYIEQQSTAFDLNILVVGLARALFRRGRVTVRTN